MCTIICNFLNFFPFYENADYYMQFLKFLSLLQKRVLSEAVSKISFLSPKTWTIICNFWNFFPFSKYVDYYMHFLEFLSKNVDYDKQFMEFLSHLQQHELSYAISKISFLSPNSGLLDAIFGISFPSQKMWTIICNFWNFFRKTWNM